MSRAARALPQTPLARGTAPRLLLAACTVLLTACAMSSQRPNGADLRQQVANAERAFARTMADREFAAFVSMLSEEAVFFSGPKPLRGKQQVSDGWKRFYDKPGAPFSWEPEQIEVLDSGTLALSTGPVRNPQGKRVATFTSIWRLEAPGTWRIVFDKGNDDCDCPKP